MHASRQSDHFQAAFDPSLFGEAARRLGRELEAYLRNAQTDPTPALPWTAPAALIKRARRALASFPRQPLSFDGVAARFSELTEEFLRHCHRLHSPHYIGHQVPAPIPLAGLFDALGAVPNQPMAVYEMGPYALAAERAVIAELGRFLGWPEGSFDAIGTHGGSLSNLTALLAARNLRYPDAWENGIATAAKQGRPAIVASADSHYSIARAAGILGLGAAQALKAPLDEKRRIDVAALPAFLDRAYKEGFDVFAIVGSACSTPIGAFDSLAELADVAADRGLWFHVDGAHGASVLLSRKHRSLVDGIDRADSLTWDAHKLLFVPALCTFTFFRDAKTSYASFQQDAPYLFDAEALENAPYDGALRTVECTKRAMALGLWGAWALFGPSLFEHLIDGVIAVARQAYERLLAADDFEAMHEPECNILCFRFSPERLRGASPERISTFQQEVRKKLIESGDFYITSTRLDGRTVLRMTVMNPLTSVDHIDRLLDAIRRHGAALVD